MICTIVCFVEKLQVPIVRWSRIGQRELPNESMNTIATGPFNFGTYVEILICRITSRAWLAPPLRYVSDVPTLQSVNVSFAVLPVFGFFLI